MQRRLPVRDLDIPRSWYDGNSGQAMLTDDE